MSQPSERQSTDHNNAVKGTEVFVGGLPRSISEEKIHKIFSSCGEIVEIRLMKDQQGNLKGFGFVRFATKESAARAVREISGTMLDGRKIGVLPSSEQNTLYFGNLNKAWSADEFEKLVFQVFSDIESIDLAMVKDTPPGVKQRNRGFAFVKFTSHAAAAHAQRVGSQPDFRLGNLHPAVQWAEEESEIDPSELAKIKIAFVRNLPVAAEESYLKQLFEPFGQVEKVVVSKKGSSPVGFVHFKERSDLERAIRVLNEKTLQGPNGGPMYKLQVEIARPMDKNKKRVHENSESNSSSQGHSKLMKSDNHNTHVQRELESADPYEEAVIALPLAVKERLLRILRLGIATRFDIDVRYLYSLKELPESIAITVLDQFMLSGAGSQNKGAYLAGLISKHLVDKAGLSQSIVSSSKVADAARDESELSRFSRRVSPPAVGSFTSHAHPIAARSDVYVNQYPSLLPYYPLSSQTRIGRVEEKVPEYLLSNRSQSFQIPRIETLEQRGHSPFDKGPEFVLSNQSQSIQIPRIGSLEQRGHSPFGANAGPPISYGRVGLKSEERYIPPVQTAPISSASYARLGMSLSSDITPVAAQQASRPQIRFDPFTGEPYKFDPFTGEPIHHPGNTTRQF